MREKKKTSLDNIVHKMRPQKAIQNEYRYCEEKKNKVTVNKCLLLQ